MSVMFRQHSFIGRLVGAIVDHQLQHLSVRHLSNNYAVICATKRPLYKRSYPTIFILPDGSSYTGRFHEPRQVLKLPLDVSSLSEADRIKWVAKRKPVKKMIIQDDVKSTFSSKKYVDLVKKKKKNE